jgi:hypothetical protein
MCPRSPPATLDRRDRTLKGQVSPYDAVNDPYYGRLLVYTLQLQTNRHSKTPVRRYDGPHGAEARSMRKRRN